ncbi:MAG: AsmA family protein [Amphritea sp.]|nr:AsmA family protein [Amphritea sp.]
MKALLKIVGGLVLLLVVVVAAGGVLLGMFFDPNEYKPEIRKLALEQAGIELNINGDLGWSVFPWLGIEINQISVNYPDQPQLAELNQAQVSVELPALLSGNIKMSSIVLDGLTLNLVKTKAGDTNWAVSGGTASNESGAAQDSGSADNTPSTAEASGGAALALDIESIAITNGNISYVDESTGSEVKLNDFTMTSGKVVTGAYFPAELSFSAVQSQNGEQQISVATQMKAEFFLDLEQQIVNIRGLSSELDLAGKPFNGKTVKVALNGDVESNLGNQTASINNLKLSAANLNASGNVNVADFSKPTITGQLDVATFSLQELLAALGQAMIPTTDPAVLKAISFNGQLGGPANTVGMNKMTLKLDDTTFNGTFVMNLANGAIVFNMQGDELNADRYMPPKTEQSESEASASSSSSGKGDERYSKEPVIPVEALKGLNMDVTLGLDKLLVSNLTITKLAMQTSAQGGLVNVSKFNADMYSGTVRNSAVIDVRKSPTRLTIKENIQGIQISDLLMDAAEVDRLTGTFSTNASLTARGESVHSIINSLNGTANVKMPDGEIKGIDIAQTICQGFNNVAALGINAEQVDRSTPFANLNSNFKFTNGVMTNKDLRTTLDAMTVKGRGEVDLPKANMDYRLGLTIEQNLFKETCAVNDNLEGVEWPVDCKGSFDDDPAKLCRPDTSVIAELFKQKAKKAVENKIREKLTGGKDGEEGGAKKLLRGLFGN